MDISSLFGAWWEDSLTHPRLDISHRRLVHGGEILLLAPGWKSLVIIWCVMGVILLLTQGWTSFVIVRRVVERFSYSPLAGYLSFSFGAWWGDSLTRPRLDISNHGLALDGEILLLAPGWTSLVIVWRMVGRFYYSPQAGHL